MVDDSKERGPLPATWIGVGKVVAKAALLFVVFNLLFAAVKPLNILGGISLYNWLVTGRERLPYGENSAESYNLSLNNIAAMMASHKVSKTKPDDEFRVAVIGDSGTWGWLLENEDTLASQINADNLVTADGRQVVAYNLGYPIMALTKDLMIIEAALEFEPDLILWPVTLESFPRSKQLVPPLVQNNPERMRSIIEAYDVGLNPADPAFVDPTYLEETIVGRRRDLADLIRLQLFGLSWSATGVDQAYPEEVTLRRSDFETDISWGDFDVPSQLSEDELALEILGAGVQMARDVPVLIVNEPVYISQGENSDLHYNAWYPRWAYDQFRQLLLQQAEQKGWHYIDLWDSIDGAEFTDSPVHLTPDGVRTLADIIGPQLLQIAGSS